MTLDDRIHIEKCLERDMTFKDIARFLRKDPTTISKEVKKNKVYQQKNSHTVAPNNCIFKRDCRLENVCNRPYPCNKRCSLCISCNKRCGKYKPGICRNLEKAPFVCNGCAKKFQCRMDKYYYRAAVAHDRYRETLSSCREGICMSENELCDLDELVSPLIRNGQSIAHIYAKHSDEIPFTSRSLYNYVEQNVLSVKNIDLPRKVKYKPRKGPKPPRKEHTWLEGRKYSDFIELLRDYPETPVVEMDTVEGSIGGKVLLTMLFRNSRCMLAFLLPGKKQEYVLDVFNRLEKALGTILFLKTFPVILTDNGSEFLNPVLLESGFDSFVRTSVYYCDPNASYQKGSLEKNHEYIRYVIPKGRSFDDYTQEDITLMINHINSTARDSLNGRNPFELASLLLDRFVLETLGLKKIEHDDVLLKPSLLRK
jgi:IS30 family transposase